MTIDYIKQQKRKYNRQSQKSHQGQVWCYYLHFQGVFCEYFFGKQMYCMQIIYWQACDINDIVGKNRYHYPLKKYLFCKHFPSDGRLKICQSKKSWRTSFPLDTNWHLKEVRQSQLTIDFLLSFRSNESPQKCRASTWHNFSRKNKRPTTWYNFLLAPTFFYEQKSCLKLWRPKPTNHVSLCKPVQYGPIHVYVNNKKYFVIFTYDYGHGVVSARHFMRELNQRNCRFWLKAFDSIYFPNKYLKKNNNWST